MRGHADVIDVTTRVSNRGAGAAAPASFVWRGRRYRVTAVLEDWREVTPWWRTAARREDVSHDDDRHDGGGGGTDGDGTGGEGRGGDGGGAQAAGARASSSLVHDVERRVWRVEAAPGQLRSSGVFELAETSRGWFLERLND